MNIHRADLNAKAVCGATYGRISNSGAAVTCPDCQPQNAKEATAQVQASLEAAAARHRASQAGKRLKQVALALLLAVAGTTQGADILGVAPDKWAHYGLLYTGTNLVYRVAEQLEVPEWERAVMAASAGMGVGVGKEYIDSITPKNFWDNNDLAADGVAVGLCLLINVKWGSLMEVHPIPQGLVASVKF